MTDWDFYSLLPIASVPYSIYLKQKAKSFKHNLKAKEQFMALLICGKIYIFSTKTPTYIWVLKLLIQCVIYIVIYHHIF